VGKSASQMCLRCAAPGELNGAHNSAPKRSATVPRALKNSLAVFYPRPEISDGLTLSDEVGIRF
jgi:hypothetical protein